MVTTVTQESVATSATLATVVSALFLHGPRGAQRDDTTPIAMVPAAHVEAVTATGLRGDTRFFHKTRRDGRENLRQVSLIDEGTLERLRERCGLVPTDMVKSQIVLAGSVRLTDLLGRTLTFGQGEEAPVLQLTIKRDPCYIMDIITPGLQDAMKDGEQGALARVVRGGLIMVGQSVTIS